MSERQRLEALYEYELLDTEPEFQFDDLTTLAAAVCNTPMAAITLIDAGRQWFKSKTGISFNETPRDIAFCAHTILGKNLFVVPDAALDQRFADNPLVAHEPWIRFYAGAPLLTEQGHAIGALAVMDSEPRHLLPAQEQALRVLANNVMARIQLRQQIGLLRRALEQPVAVQEMLKQSYLALQTRMPPEADAVDRAMSLLRSQTDEQVKEASLSQLFINSLPGIFYAFDQDGRFLRWNRNLELVTGYSHAEIAQAHPSDFFESEADKALMKERVTQVFETGHAELEANLLLKSGRTIPYYLSGTRIELDGRFFLCGMGIDISERRLSEASLRLRHRALEASVNAIIITDINGAIEYANPAFERMTGYRVGEVTGRNFRFLHGDDINQRGLSSVRTALRTREECSAVLRNYRKDGELFWNDFHIAPVRNPEGAVTHFVGVLNDITELKRYEEQLEHQANYDALTGLVNKSVLRDRVRQAIASAQRHGSGVTIGFMDLDNFKFVNDSLGHNTGDALLKRVAERLATCMRSQDTIARYGGDEFAFVLIDQTTEDSVAILMDRLLKTVERPFDIEGHKFFISCSIGLCFYPRDGSDVDTLLKNADAAMYRAKEAGRNNFQFYTPAMNARITERLSMESKLRQALTNEELVLHYQPKFHLATGKVVGIEALLRWEPRDGERVLPSAFIPLAEETGLIVPIGEWVLDTACTHNKQLQDSGLPPIGVAVNISARQFDRKMLVESVALALEQSGLESRYLELELTESLVMHNPEEVIRLMEQLREMGLQLAIDDFGTGYSSLSYLQRFPLDRLKIDQSFVRDISADPNDAIIARAVISLGHSLGLSVIAEGVSNHEQLSFLRDNGCDEIQGYLYSRPLPFAELRKLLSAAPRLMKN
jgi:diguanylate cyclase (GGDEF)-like protein/PAS domain S-box-containing protein